MSLAYTVVTVKTPPSDLLVPGTIVSMGIRGDFLALSLWSDTDTESPAGVVIDHEVVVGKDAVEVVLKRRGAVGLRLSSPSAMSLAWTKAAPTVPGFWLYAVADTRDVRAYRMYGVWRGLSLLRVRCLDYPRFKTLRGWWSGPIDPPDESVKT